MAYDEIHETVYEHMSGNPTFTVTAEERWSCGMIRRLSEKYPEEVKIIAQNQDGSILAHLPFEWMRIVPKRKLGPLSEERRLANVERLARYRASKKVNQDDEK